MKYIIILILTSLTFAQTNQTLANFTDATSVNSALIKAASAISGTGVLGNPLLVNNIGFEPNQSDIVPDIQVGSPAIDAGEDLTYLHSYFLSTYGWDLSDMLYDIYGNERGANGKAIRFPDGKFMVSQ